MGSGFHIFSLANVPVFVGPFYLLLLVMLASSSQSIAAGLMWALIVTVSLLVHEFGHALAAKRLGLNPRIMIHGLGGTTYHSHAPNAKQEAWITFAGPLAGFLLGAAVYAYDLSGVTLSSKPEIEQRVVAQLLYVNIFWTCINLLPIYPMDGGQLFRIGLQRLLRPLTAERITFGVGLALSAVWMFFAFRWRGFGLLFFLGAWTAISNVQGFRQGGPPVHRVNHAAKRAIKEVEAAFNLGDFEQARRLGHRLRMDDHLPQDIAAKTWRFVGVSAARTGHHEEAYSLLRKAEPTADVVEAKIECLHQLGRKGDLERLISSAEFAVLPQQRQQEIQQILQETD